MKLTIVFPVLNQFPLANLAIKSAIDNLQSKAPGDVNLVIIDNGSDQPFAEHFLPPEQQLNIRFQDSIGVYPLFWETLKLAGDNVGELVAFFHSDLIITEKNWATRVKAAFSGDENLCLIGFVGSNEIDAAGGRGLGTTSNFQGGEYVEDKPLLEGQHTWRGSAARIHGRENMGFTPAAVVDGCAMIFRTKTLRRIAQRLDFPPHHFYDRLLSCEVQELGCRAGVLGIACDHISGQTVNQEPKYNTMAERWAKTHGFTMDGVHNWDSVLYRRAEQIFLTEYRDIKHFIPRKV